MTDDNLTLRLEGGLVATFISLSQKERFLRNHFHKGKFIHGFNMIKKSKEGYFYDYVRIPKELAIKNKFRKIENDG